MCPPLNLRCQTLTVTYGPPDASGTHRSRAQRVCQTHDLIGLRAHQTRAQRGLPTARTSDSHHQTHSSASSALLENLAVQHADPNKHRSRSRPPASGVERPVRSACSSQNPTAHQMLRPASSAFAPCVHDFTKISHQRNRKYTVNFLKSAESRLATLAGGREEPKPLSTQGTPPPLQIC